MTALRGRLAAVILTCTLLAVSPMAAFAQASGQPSPANSAGSGAVAPASPQQGRAESANPAASGTGNTQQAGAPSAGASAAGSAAPAPASASAEATQGPNVRAVPTPVGGNAQPTEKEPVSIFAWL